MKPYVILYLLGMSWWCLELGYVVVELLEFGYVFVWADVSILLICWCLSDSTRVVPKRCFGDTLASCWQRAGDVWWCVSTVVLNMCWLVLFWRCYGDVWAMRWWYVGDVYVWFCMSFNIFNICVGEVYAPHPTNATHRGGGWWVVGGRWWVVGGGWWVVGGRW